MPFKLKTYQTQTLAALRRYLEGVARLGRASTAFYDQTGRPYLEAPGLEGVPYVCLRVPTGGGKTLLAASAIPVAADAFLHVEAPTVLWLVPSQTIRDQTLLTLSDRSNPNHQVLAERFGSNVRVLSVADALITSRADFDSSATIIVATLQAFRIEETEGRKVYEPNGALMDHFADLPEALSAGLEADAGGSPKPSLANVLRLRRPIMIVDEAHNARTDLSFDTLGRLSPSLVVELTATPVRPDEHRPEKGVFASNVLHHVSAAELKVAEMIKLPVVLRGRSDPRETLADAIAWLDVLNDKTVDAQSKGASYIRPIMLIQAEPKSKDRPTLHAEAVRDLLVQDFSVPAAHVAIATGSHREIEDVDLFAPTCPIRFIVTQQALREGWDCAFAYVLCSLAEQKSSRAVEQLLGRVLRMPNATRQADEDLNRAYAFATTTSFQAAAAALRDGLVANGFERLEARNLIQVDAPTLEGFEPGGAALIFEEAVPAGVRTAAVADAIHRATGGRAVLDVDRGVLVARGSLTEYDRKALMLAMPSAEAAVTALAQRSRGANLRSGESFTETVRLAIPRLFVRSGGQLELFDRGHFLDTPWALETCDASAVLDHLAPPVAAGEEARLDVTDQGRLRVDFVSQLHEQLELALQERGWTRPALINWIDRRLPVSSRRDITRTSSTLYIAKSLEVIAEAFGWDLAQLARAKFKIVEALQSAIARHRADRESKAFQSALFPKSGLDFATASEPALLLDEQRYSYHEPYRGTFTFQRHAFRVIGDLEPRGEEFDCAVYLDRLSAVKTWVRNTARQPTSFWLQTSTDKFYPDFVAELHDGRYLAVEYKGAHLSTADDAKEKQLVGDLWAERSNGRCLFTMIQNREFQRIDRLIGAITVPSLRP